MLCNSRTKWDFIPELSLKEDNIEVVQEMKYFGYVMRSNVRTCSNTEYLVKKEFKIMWLIRRLKGLGANTSQLIDALQKKALSVLWLGAPAWFCQTTEKEKKYLDRVAKIGLRIIFGDFYCGFNNALLSAKMLRPTEQIANMTRRFATKIATRSKFSQWFQPAATKTSNTRSSKNGQKYQMVLSRTARFGKSPIPYLTHIFNSKDK